MWIYGSPDYKVCQTPNLLSYLAHISRKFHWDQASMASATASKAVGGQVQILHAIIVLLSWQKVSFSFRDFI